jgi:hypothetical protein
MSILAKLLKTFGIVGGVAVLFFSLSLFSDRHSLYYWAVSSALILPVIFWLRLGFKKWCAGLLFIALGLAASPIDISVTRLARPGVRLLPISYGIGCEPGTACYGCIVPPYPARKAIVISYY